MKCYWSRKNIFNFHSYNSLLKVTITFLVFFISIGYSALNSSLMVSGDLIYRASGSIRITGVRISDATNDGIEMYSPSYTKNTVSLGMKLPDFDSTVTYEVTIENSSSNKYSISSMTDEIQGNPDVKYVHNYANDIIDSNTTVTVLLTYNYDPDLTVLPSDKLKETTLMFNFEIAITNLYEKIKSDYEDGGNVELYTGDKSTFIGDKEVYYYKGATTNNNVIFAGFCWRIFRTTETGGVKMIYNGILDSDEQCPDTIQYSTIGNSAFNSSDILPAYAGYMYNKIYTRKFRGLSDNIIDVDLSEYNIISNDVISPYTFESGTNKWTSTSHNDGTISTIEFSVKTGGEYYLSYTASSEASWDIGSVYVDGVRILEFSGTDESNVDLGSLTPENVIKVEYSKDDYASSGEDNIAISLGKLTESPAETRWKYGNSFTYSDGTYTLTDTENLTLSSSTTWYLDNYHYTCWNESGTCTTISYIYYYNNNYSDHYRLYYIDLIDGKSIEDALNEMLYDDNVNTINSEVKTKIDTWYKDNMTAYTGYLEDTVWCNDRSVIEKGGWNPDGGGINAVMSFNSDENTTNLTCKNVNDRFSVSSTKGNGKLTYPVGLMTRQEQSLAYYRADSPISAGAYSNWTLSPAVFGLKMMNFAFYNDGEEDWLYVNRESVGIRPVISLRSDLEYSSGNGTVESPFQVIVSGNRSLYQKMKADYTRGKAELYTGDKSTFVGDKEIYYYKGATANNNVIFADFCWKMYRTTETGGVKMIYNGVPDEGECSGAGASIGKSAFNSNWNSLAYAGYMYNKAYDPYSKSISSSYLYGNSFIYSGGNYTLVNTQELTLNSSTISDLDNYHYTCWNESGTCKTLSYIYIWQVGQVLRISI